MRVGIYYWGCADYSKELGYNDQEIVEVDNPIVITNEIFNKGYNVMMVHPSMDSAIDVAIRVDNSTLAFRSR